ncbi:hypothetical protein ACQKO7_18975 [Pseudomonas putida]|uniref:hypothetical protein n=1 Tax=Pseudomonas putida TaxID=303 RepID=UPI003D0542E8
MSEEKRAEELERGLDQALKALISLDARLESEASQRIAAYEKLSRRIEEIVKRLVD